MEDTEFAYALYSGDPSSGWPLGCRPVAVVWATFVRDGEGPTCRLVLGGEVHDFEKPTAEGRPSFAELVYYEEHSDPLGYDDYSLEYMECVTYNGSRLRVDPESVPPTTIRFEREPADEVPRLGVTHLETT